ncbi:Na(+)/H(+) antiporter subunit C [Georgenia sp. AZ-5]|uniref:Na(+)/H(+) antiporter subunit C n=1 Tax=Georgenia sp. AZ-5 TaxID=3367526 RepID=UPI003754B841
MIEMAPAAALVVLVAVLVGTGVYLVLERSLSRVIIGIALISNGVNVLMLVAGGRAGGPPILGETAPEDMSDPLPQAMVLTAIVITLGMTAFVLAMAYRSWQLNGHDEVQDDLEDRRIARRAARDELSERATDDAGTSLAQEAAVIRDETATAEEDQQEHADRGHHPAAVAADDEEAR